MDSRLCAWQKRLLEKEQDRMQIDIHFSHPVLSFLIDVELSMKTVGMMELVYSVFLSEIICFTEGVGVPS